MSTLAAYGASRAILPMARSGFFRGPAAFASLRAINKVLRAKRMMQRKSMRGVALATIYGKYGIAGMRAARKIVKFTSKYGRRSAPPARMRARQHQQFSPGDQLNYKTLYVTVLNVCQLSDGQNLVSARQSLNTKLSGIRICDVFNTFMPLSAETPPLEIHWVLGQMAEEVPITDRGTTMRANIMQDFFRDGTPNTSRTSNFIDATTGAPWEGKYICNPLNPSNFHIMCHWKKVITGATTEAIAVGTHRWKIDKYFKINKPISFYNMSDQVGKKPFFILCWYQTATSDTHPASTQAGKQWCQRSLSYVSYYR